eukprot:scaffold4855_cov99-Cylindrotheca_fusiformis.AAC.10
MRLANCFFSPPSPSTKHFDDQHSKLTNFGRLASPLSSGSSDHSMPMTKIRPSVTVMMTSAKDSWSSQNCCCCCFAQR